MPRRAAQWAVDPHGDGADDRRERRDQRRDGRLRAELRAGARRSPTISRLNRWINVVWLMVAWVVLQVMMGWLGGRAGLSARDARACRRLRRGAAAAAAAAAVALPEGLGRPAASAARCPSRVRLEQPVQVDDDIFHLGIVDRALGLAAPRVFGGGVAVVNADEVDRVRGRKSRPRGSLTRPPKTR